MNKTLLQKFTAKAFSTHTAQGGYRVKESLFTGLIPEMNILKQASLDLLSPRPEAINNLLRLSREMNSGN